MPRTEETLNIVKKVQEEFLMEASTSRDTIEKKIENEEDVHFVKEVVM